MADDLNISPLAGQIAVQYPALAKIMENISLGYGPKGAYGFMEAYPPWEQMNPTPGRYNISVFNRDVKGQDLRDMIAADALHFLGARDPKTGEDIDPVWRGFREQFWRSLTPEQEKMNREAFHRDTMAGYAGQGGFESWMDRSRLDAYLRGGLFPQINPEWQKPGIFSDQQQQMLKNMSRYLQAFTAEAPDLEGLKQELSNYGFRVGPEGEPTGERDTSKSSIDDLLEEILGKPRSKTEAKEFDPKMRIEESPQGEGFVPKMPHVQPYPGLRTPFLQQASQTGEAPPNLQGLQDMSRRLEPGESRMFSPQPLPRPIPPWQRRNPQPANEAAQPGMPGGPLQAAPLLQYIGDLLSFGKDQTGNPEVPGNAGRMLQRRISPDWGYRFRTLPLGPQRVPPLLLPNPANQNVQDE